MTCIYARYPYASLRFGSFRQLALSSSSFNRTPPSRQSSRRSISITPCNWKEIKSEHEHYYPGETLGSDYENVNQTETSGSQQASTKLDSEDWQTPSESLPQSPIVQKLEQSLVRKASKKKRRLRPSREDLADLSRNPWAMALISPPRFCTVTGARLPRELLTEWGLFKRADSERLWPMPFYSLKKSIGNKPSRVTPKSSNDDSTQSEKEVSSKSVNSTRLPVFRIVDRLFVLKDITKQIIRSGATKRPLVSRLIPHRWKYPLGPLSPQDERLITWREDMPEFVLKHSRELALTELRWASNRYKEPDHAARVWSPVPMEGSSEAALVDGLKQLPPFESMETGVVLIMGPRAEINRRRFYEEVNLETQSAVKSSDREARNSVPREERGIDSMNSTFPDFVTLPQTQSKVPVFDLSALLSDREIDKLGSSHWRFTENVLFFRPHCRVCVRAILNLWKIKGSVMYDKEFLSEGDEARRSSSQREG